MRKSANMNIIIKLDQEDISYTTEIKTQKKTREVKGKLSSKIIKWTQKRENFMGARNKKTEEEYKRQQK